MFFPVVTQVCTCLPKQRSHIILWGAFHAALVIYKMNTLIITHNNITALKIPEHKIFILCVRKVIAQGFKIIYQFLFIVWLAQRIQEIVFEIQQVCHDGLFAKNRIGETFTVVNPCMATHLQFCKLRQAPFI